MKLNLSRLKSNPHLCSCLSPTNFKDAILMHVTLCILYLIWGIKSMCQKMQHGYFNHDNVHDLCTG